MPGMYLMQSLWELGPGFAGEPGAWQELLAYVKLSGDLREDWELKAIMSMSRAYVGELRNKDANNPLRIAPVDREAMND